MKQITTIIFATMSLAGLVSSSVADDATLRSHDITIDDYFTVASVNSFAVSPDGTQVAYTEDRWDIESDKRTSELWVISAEGGPPQRLTFDAVSQSAPAWSPDGRHLYFLSPQERPGEKHPPFDGTEQVWRVTSEGKSLQPVTRVKDGIARFHLSKNGKALYYQIDIEHVDDDWKSLREKFDELEYGHGIRKLSQIWRLDLVTWREEKIIDEAQVINSFDVSRDESAIVMQTTPDNELIFNEGWSQVDLFDRSSGTTVTLTKEGWRDTHPSPFGWIDEVMVSDDGQAVTFTVSYDGYPPKLYVSDVVDGQRELHEIACPEPITIAGGAVQWRPGSRDLCFLGQDHARSRLYCVPNVRGASRGELETLTPGDVVMGSFQFSSDGATLIVSNTPLDDGRDLYSVENGTLRRLTHVNPQIDHWKLPQISIVEWTAPDGVSIQGILELPHDYNAEQGPLPCIVQIHGGPTAASLYCLNVSISGRTILPAQGYAVFSPNYRGSTGFGTTFMTDLIGRENDIEVQDILAGIEAIVERGIADPDRLGVSGWSNGGFLTNCLITSTDRFKAASSGAGVVDQVIQWGTEDTPGHVINYMQALPWENADAFMAASPLYGLEGVSTPTLIHVGADDARVPAAHARALYRALKHYLDVPTELVVYPGAGHGLKTATHRRAKMTWDLAWYEKYMAP